MIKEYYINVWKYHMETHYFVELTYAKKDTEAYPSLK
jgi:hypothetical protein